MKLRTFAFVLLMMLSCSLHAQERQQMKKSIGLTFTALGCNDVTNWERATLTGGADYRGKSFYSFGVSYVHPIRSWLAVESGVEYSNHTITVDPMDIPNSDMDFLSYDKSVSLISIPVTARVSFLNYFFVNGGFILDLDTASSSPIDSQTGFGILYGIGATYSLSNGIGAFVNGYYKSHALAPLEADSNSYRWRLNEVGVRVGITYSF